MVADTYLADNPTAKQDIKFTLQRALSQSSYQRYNAACNVLQEGIALHAAQVESMLSNGMIDLRIAYMVCTADSKPEVSLAIVTQILLELQSYLDKVDNQCTSEHNRQASHNSPYYIDGTHSTSGNYAVSTSSQDTRSPVSPARLICVEEAYMWKDKILGMLRYQLSSQYLNSRRRYFSSTSCPAITRARQVLAAATTENNRSPTLTATTLSTAFASIGCSLNHSGISLDDSGSTSLIDPAASLTAPMGNKRSAPEDQDCVVSVSRSSSSPGHNIASVKKRKLQIESMPVVVEGTYSKYRPPQVERETRVHNKEEDQEAESLSCGDES